MRPALLAPRPWTNHLKTCSTAATPKQLAKQIPSPQFLGQRKPKSTKAPKRKKEVSSSEYFRRRRNVSNLAPRGTKIKKENLFNGDILYPPSFRVCLSLLVARNPRA
jgi:hypothetical protein